MIIPPRPVRRLLIAPAVVALCILAVVGLPLWLIAASFAVRWLPGRWRGLRLLWFALVYLVREAVGLAALFMLWVLSGFGWKLHSDRFVRAHVVLVGWFVRGLVGSARRVLGLRVTTEELPDRLAVVHPFREGSGEDHRPVLVFSRHAGAGDSFVLVDLLVNTWGRRPRIVLKEDLQLDPCIDVALHRIPSRFIGNSPGAGHDVVASIAELAAGLEDDGALILFPEGGNFSDARRTRAIERLAESGLDDLVPLAEDLTNVLPPRPSGAFAAIDAQPEADVMFVAHTGLERMSSLRELWNELPMRSGVRMTWWTVPAETIPRDHDERVMWLFEWWERIDQWIEDTHQPGVPSSPLP